MSQYTINIGALPNDGTGDPLRTAFNEVNLNFNQVFAAGPVLSNVRIANNIISTINTNGNLVLSPNGIGIVQANSHIIPNQTRLRNLGSADNRWLNVYAQYVNVGSTLSVDGDLSVSGNLSVTGNIIQIGNIVTDSKTIQLANTATTSNAANGAGITVGANDNIATLLYNANPIAPGWTMNTNLSVAGNVLGNLAAGGTGQVQFNNNGQLSAASYDFNYDNGNSMLYVTAVSLAGDANGSNGLFVGEPAFTDLGSDVIGQFTGNVTSYTQINMQNISSNAAASADYIITANNGNDTTRFLDLGMTSSTWNGSQENSLGNLIGPNNGYLYVQDGNLSLGTKAGNVARVWTFDTSGNLTAPGNISGNYFVGNGALLTGIVSSYGNSNVATYLTTYSGNISGGNVGVSGAINAVGEITSFANIVVGPGGYFQGDGSQLTNLPSITTPVALANLTAVAGARAFIDNGNLAAAGNFGAQVGSGGSNVVPVWSDGTNWYIG